MVTTPTDISETARRLRSHIAASGPVSFAEFMQTALYAPDCGYYASGRQCVGRGGDFITNVSTGPVFGELVAIHCRNYWDRLGRPERFRIIEQGANDGSLFLDVLAALERDYAELFGRLEGCLIEPLPGLEARQRAKLANYSSILTWNPAAPGPKTPTLFFANELLDAFPVHCVILKPDGWKELAVDCGKAGGFIWMERPVEDAGLAKAIEEKFGPVACHLNEGFRGEIALGVGDWLSRSLRFLGPSPGQILLFDYGFFREDFWQRPAGTLRAYAQHRQITNALQSPGEVDLTAHVDFTALSEIAEARSLRVVEIAPQARFLTRLALPLLAKWEETGKQDAAGQIWLRQFNTLIHPAHFGANFHAIVLEK